jgi:hypothetical protein
MLAKKSLTKNIGAHTFYTRYSLLATRYSLLATRYSLLATRHFTIAKSLLQYVEHPALYQRGSAVLATGDFKTNDEWTPLTPSIRVNFCSKNCW